MSTTPQASKDSPAGHRNAVTLCGRLPAEPEPRELPSGDVLLTFRLVVDRPPERGESRRRVDTIDCAVWSGRVQRTVRSWGAGDIVSVEGHLRRRFRRFEGGATSRVEVEVIRARRSRQGS
jgi:single-strand DNA-binding protein